MGVKRPQFVRLRSPPTGKDDDRAGVTRCYAELGGAWCVRLTLSRRVLTRWISLAVTTVGSNSVVKVRVQGSDTMADSTSGWVILCVNLHSRSSRGGVVKPGSENILTGWRWPFVGVLDHTYTRPYLISWRSSALGP